MNFQFYEIKSVAGDLYKLNLYKHNLPFSVFAVVASWSTAVPATADAKTIV